MSIPFLLNEKPTVLPVGSPESGREARERFFRAPQLVRCSTAIVSGTPTRNRNSSDAMLPP
jgi:hypothetical protein